MGGSLRRRRSRSRRQRRLPCGLGPKLRRSSSVETTEHSGPLDVSHAARRLLRKRDPSASRMPVFHAAREPKMAPGRELGRVPHTGQLQVKQRTRPGLTMMGWEKQASTSFPEMRGRPAVPRQQFQQPISSSPIPVATSATDRLPRNYSRNCSPFRWLPKTITEFSSVHRVLYCVWEPNASSPIKRVRRQRWALCAATLATPRALRLESQQDLLRIRSCHLCTGHARYIME